MIPLLLVSGECSAMLAGGIGFVVLFLMVLGGVLGFLLNIATYLQIRNASPLMYLISGTVKPALQAFLALLVFHLQVGFLVSDFFCTQSLYIIHTA